MTTNSTTIPMQDKEIMQDVLMSEKALTSAYNTNANECATPELRTEMLRILQEEHSIQASVFAEMHRRGWYPTPMAPQEKIQTTKQKYESGSM